MTSADPRKAMQDLDSVLHGIQSEPLEQCIARERSAFDRLAAPFSDRIALCGAGPLGKGVCDGLRQAGIEPIGFVDNNPRLWGTQVRDLRVLSPTDAVKEFGKLACFVVTIYNGSTVRRQLKDLGCERVVPFPALFWKYSDVFTPTSGIDLPHRLRDEIPNIKACYASLHDDASRRELMQQVSWRYWLDYDLLSPGLPPQDTYFPLDLITPLSSEVFVDCGSFDGDSIRSFVSHWGGNFQHAFAFEPDPANRQALGKTLRALGIEDRASTMPFAVGDYNGPASFTCTSSASSHLDNGASQATVECRKLDSIDWPVSPTFIKMDIESAEPLALAGARELLNRCHPILAVCTYHRSTHLWEIPSLIHSIATDYRIFLRRYAEECWEGVCYAIPENRLKKA
jgi:FkbM family methyltransferase